MESSGPAIAPYEPSYQTDLAPLPPEPGGGITEKLWLLWRNRKFLWRVFWLSTLISVVASLIIPVKYKSTAKLVPGENFGSSSAAGILSKVAGGGLGGLGMGGMDAAGMLGIKTPGAFYVDVLKSRTVQDELVKQFDLQHHYRKKYLQDARKLLNKNTSIEEDKKSGVITLDFVDWDQRFAQSVVEKYIREMDNLSAKLNTSAAHREREFLEARLKNVKQDLDEASRQLSEFSSKHGVMDVQQQGRSMMDAAARIQGELIGAQSELKGLEAIYSPDHIKVRTARARIAELQSQLKKTVGNYTDPTTAGDAQSIASGSYPSLRSLPALGYRYADLYRQAKTQEAIYEFLTQQYEMARVQEVKEFPTVRVMDEPNFPDKKNSPIRSLVVGLSVFVALIFGCLWIVQKDKWDHLPPHDSRRMLGSEVAAEFKGLAARVTGNRERAGH